ncbi:hypothetical protein T439DRAFT_153210 [Meredithblackwellia eburnea MCA 4105]
MFCASVPILQVRLCSEAWTSSSPSSPLQRGDLVEIQGASGSGKTQLLLFLTMVSILPQQWRAVIDSRVWEVHVGGKEKHVAFIECSRQFDIQRLALLLRTHLTSQLALARGPGSGPSASQVIENEVIESLKRLHVYFPTSTSQLAATILTLPDAFIAKGSKLAYLLVDGFSEFYWEDQAERERLGGRSGSTIQSTAGNNESPMRYLMLAIAQLRKRLSPVIFITNWALRDAVVTHNSEEGLPFVAHHLVAPYPHITSHSGSEVDRNDPFKLPPAAGPNTNIPPVPLKYHISAFAPPVKRVAVEKGFDECLRVRMEGLGEGSHGFKLVLRAAGGKEVGSCEWDVLESSLVT